MVSDGYFEHFSVAEPESPSAHSYGRKLKRLKRAADAVFSVPFFEQSEDDLPPASMPASANSGLTNPVESAEVPSGRLHLPEVKIGIEDDNADFGSLSTGSEKEKYLQRDLMLDSVDAEINLEEGLREERMEPVIGAPDERSHDVELVTPRDTMRETKDRRKRKKKKINGGLDDDTEHIRSTAAINNRREKERRERIQQLRADSQRVLRETRDASFKSMPTVPKPIPSILEKIRRRKLEISKKTASVKGINISSRYLDRFDGESVEFDFEEVNLQRGVNKEAPGLLAKEVVNMPIEANVVPDAGLAVEPNDTPDNMSPEGFSIQKGKQELLSDHKDCEIEEDPLADSSDNPVEEEFTPSLHAVKLEFDSTAQNSYDEENNEKEDVNPHLDQDLDLDLSLPIKDPVKDFLDKEAQEEDDSDGYPFNWKQDDEEDIEDAEELIDMMATHYVEKSIDNEKRNQLHQAWLEQQEDAGMENLLLREYQEYEEVEKKKDEETCGSKDGLDLRSLVQINLRKAKQTISNMFTDKDDLYISSEDDESGSMLTKQSLYKKLERQTRSLSPEMDESSREVFSRIKKLNVMPENKKIDKTSALSDLSVMKNKRNAFLKPSFVSRTSNSSLSSKKNHKRTVVRPFIFRQDDRNSRSSFSEESSCMEDSRSTRNPSAKLSSPQDKFYTQTTSASSESNSSTSLYDILRRPYKKSESGVTDAIDARAQSIFAAFRTGKR
ncbi:hypothetical protein SAY87_012569 [Trapa incisa]|uniref:Uncharacterized protein n=1 Tax=Trapa incisa TaxID=236973 RepID=A0AAN7JJJ0_9MYRT|nr:hypothetical protein SAY87_012569 [Trapa incisa]